MAWTARPFAARSGSLIGGCQYRWPDGGPPAQASAVLGALADLAPASDQRSSALVIPTEWFRWLPLSSLRLGPSHGQIDPYLLQRLQAVNTPEMRAFPIDRKFGERLAAIDQLRAGQRPLRVGWLFVAGRSVGEEGRSRRVFHPLVTIPVRVVRQPAVHTISTDCSRGGRSPAEAHRRPQAHTIEHPTGSYPEGRWFKSSPRHQTKRNQRCDVALYLGQLNPQTVSLSFRW